MSTPAHSAALNVQQFLTKNGMTLCPILTISPGVTFFLNFPRSKKVLKRKYFTDVEEAKQKQMAEAPKGININEFKNYFEQWKKCLNRCIASNGDLRVTEV